MKAAWLYTIRDYIRAHWVGFRRVGATIFVLAVLSLIGILATKVQWADVFTTIRAYDASVMWIGAGLVALSFLVYSSFDLMGRRYTRHRLSRWKTMLICFTSYVFTLNFGAPIGAAGLRFRLYCRQGLSVGVVTRVMAFSLVTNWLGYLWLGGAMFALEALELPPDWKIGSAMLRILGVAMLLAACGYLLLCLFSAKRSWVLRGHKIELPSLRLALLQSGLAALNWAVMAAIIYVLLLQKVDYPSVLSALLLSAIAGALAHIPGGLGVTESVFVTVLTDTPQAAVLGALIVYRAMYYLFPLLVASLVYLILEAGPAEAAEPQSAK